MSKKLKYCLQLFAEGGDGATGESDAGTETGESLPNRIPERARAMYEKAKERKRSSSFAESNALSQNPSNDTEEEKPSRLSYADLIKSDEYKDEHRAYMDKTIGDRLKKYKGIESENESMRNALGIVANKYGLDASSEDFLTALQQKINEDSSYYEDYAMEHNISTDDAKEILTLRHQVAMQEQERKRAEEEARQNEFVNALRQRAEATRALYPDFNLEIELQNPMFQRLLSATNGDTTAAYRTVHSEELALKAGLQAKQTATMQVSNTVASNMQRPIENGLSSQASSTMTVDWRRANIQQIRQYAEEQRRMRR